MHWLKPDWCDNFLSHHFSLILGQDPLKTEISEFVPLTPNGTRFNIGLPGHMLFNGVKFQ